MHPQVERIGPVHQAGSDSLLTGATFFKVQNLFSPLFEINGLQVHLLRDPQDIRTGLMLFVTNLAGTICRIAAGCLQLSRPRALPAIPATDSTSR